MQHIKHLFFVSLLMVFSCQAKLHAQNLVPNGSFEEEVKCQTNYEKPKVPKPWKITGTPDLYLDSCELISPSQNIIGACELLSGKAMVGMVWDLPSKQNYYWVEKLRAKLTRPLERDSLYLFSIFINLGAYSPSSIKQFTVHIAQEITNHFTPPQEIVTIDIPQPMVSGNWVHLVDTIKATGGEKYLAIGNYLEPDNFIKLRKSKPSNVKCYLFIDSVSITPLFKETVAPTINDTIVLAGINFNTNEAILLPEAYPTLNKLLASLPDKNFSLHITGHTDSIGSLESNMTLSLNRALAVAQYFNDNRINIDVITTEGVGPNIPIAPNSTEEGRALNRRVEIIIKRY